MAGIFFPIFILFTICLAYWYFKKRSSGSFNPSILYVNRGYGLSCEEPQHLLQPGQHEYSNPIEFNKEMKLAD